MLTSFGVNSTEKTSRFESGRTQTGVNLIDRLEIDCTDLREHPTASVEKDRISAVREYRQKSTVVLGDLDSRSDLARAAIDLEDPAAGTILNPHHGVAERHPGRSLRAQSENNNKS